ncbi:helix-turn-helix domain-containing protein [Tsukamurella sp. 8F]|uniref:IclR family transcriptional regulator n=1 Tax=unclassified Tsukamurella TaxID=2633480 RepID=UPI0023BA39E0|nr:MULTISPECIES: helix-turn-helix domain-containing protein [unclassified Tsukamurella]MDF0529241.1 helix-turn-helix domain-containing protein [Tsukamurella sp. 8J]MDF0585426.1 helix-turn-helix domain-containing protein [Tsukamurella sp. 8F]
MQRYSIVKKPSYAVAVVDNALRLLTLLRRESDGLRVQEAAEYLGVAPSTAHRLLSTLVYRGFAEQDASRRYVAGAALRGDPEVVGVAGLPATIAGPLGDLAHATGETVSLLRRDGTGVEFLGSIESRHRLRVGERTGTLLPAHLTSGGKALLAGLGDTPVRTLYTSQAARLAGSHLAGQDLDALIAELRRVREVGYALNLGLTEPGICAIGMAVPAAGQPSRHAVAVSVPSIREAVLTDPETTSALWACCAALHASITEAELLP